MSTDSFFGGAPALSFKDPAWRGVVRGGRIVDEPKMAVVTNPQGVVQKWDDGSPRQQLIVTLICDGSAEYAPGRTSHDERDPSNPHDLGKRRLYIKSHMIAAVREALKKVHVEGLRVGGSLFIAWTDEQEAKVKGNNNAKLFASVYVVPAVGLPTEGGAADPFGGPGLAPGPAEQAAPAQRAPAAAGGVPNPFGGQQAAPAAPAPNPFA